MTFETELALRVFGPRACFTNPIHKVERATYPVITPSAARNILQHIYWHPDINFRPYDITILKPLRFDEFGSKELKDPTGDTGRTLRHNVVLLDVDYIIRYRIVKSVVEGYPDFPLQKHIAIMNRRIASSQSGRGLPYFGIREYQAYFEAAPAEYTAQPINMKIGTMLFDIRYEPMQLTNWKIKGDPLFFNAEIKQGVLNVPQDLYRLREVPYVLPSHV